MIGKIVKGKSFKGCVSYVLSKEDTKLLDSEGVLNTDAKSIINSFYMQSLMNTNLAKSVGHIPLSYSKEDESRLTDAFMVQLAKEYMKAMKIENTQFIIVRHNNTDNPHCHIVFNRVNNEGKTISDKNDRYRNEKVCKQLKDKYNLTYGKGKDQTDIQKLKGAEKTKYEIYHSIKANLAKTANWMQFEQLLKQQGITVAYKYKGQTNEIQGVSFKKGDYSFKGSDVDRSYSYSKLNNQLTSNSQKQTIDIQSKDTTQQSNSSDSASIVGSVLGALGGLSNIQTHGDDYQDEAFKNRKKKKKRRGFGL